MKKRVSATILIAIAFVLIVSGCLGEDSPNNNTPAPPISEGTGNGNETDPENNSTAEGIKVRMTVGNETLTATFIDNPTSRSLIERFPLTLSMEDLYAREMYCSLQEELPAHDAGRYGYDVGDISYWTPGHGVVIFYEQNGEIISGLQPIGRIDAGVEIFKETGDTEVTFELIE